MKMYEKVKGMADYVKTGHSSTLCFINVLKLVTAILIVLYGIKNHWQGTNLEPLFFAAVLMIPFLLINWIVLMAFRSSGRGGWIIRIFNFLIFIFSSIALIYAAYVFISTIAVLIKAMNAGNDALSEINRQMKNFGVTFHGSIGAGDLVKNLITTIIEFAIAAFCIIVPILYHFRIWKTFGHIKKEVKGVKW